MDSRQTKTDTINPIVKFFRLNSIRSRLIFVLAIFSILPVAVTGLFINTISGNFARAKVQDSLQAVTALKNGQVRNWAKDIQANLATSVSQDIQDLSTTILKLEPDSLIYATSYQRELEVFNRIVSSLPIYNELMLLDAKGTVIISTSADQVGKNLADRKFFKQFMAGNTVTNATFDQAKVYVTQPLMATQGAPLGVLVARANLNPLYSILGDKTGLGTTGESYLIDNDRRLLSPLKTRVKGSGLSVLQQEIGNVQLQSVGVENALSQHPGVGVYTNYNGVPVIGAYQWIPELQAAILSEQSQSEAYKFLTTTQTLTFLALVFSSALAVLAALSISNNFSKPLTDLADTAQKIAAGNLELRAKTAESNPSGQVEEINALAVSFNSMTAQLRNLIGSLENRVAERTRQLQVRSEQLMTASEVGRYATSLLDTEQLIQRTVDLIKESFDLYYVGLFTVDETGEWAVLKSGTGRAGQAMLQHGHRLPISRGISSNTQERRSMIGWCITNNQARISLEAIDDPVRLATPDLPDTRSEAAIPLRSRGQVLGAMTIQSSKPGAFDKEMIAVFQNMADQVAVALDNARLFAQIQRALESSHQAYSEITHQAWQEKLRSKPLLLRRDSLGLSRRIQSKKEIPAISGDQPASGEDSITIPIRTRGQTIGYINAQKRPPTVGSAPGQATAVGEATSDNKLAEWRLDEIKLLDSLVEQLGIALDSARLFEDAQLRAKRERIVGDITSHIRTTLDIQTILLTAAREMRNELGLAEAEVRLREMVQPSAVTGRLVQKGQPRIQPETGYRCLASGETIEATGNWSPEMLQARYTGKVVQPDQLTLVLPIKIRTQVQGVIKLCKLAGSDPWAQDEIDLVETLSERLGAAVESARLYEETRRRMERERLTSEIIAKMRASNDPRTILQTASSELRKALNVDRAQPLVKTPQATGSSSGELAPDANQPGEAGVDSDGNEK
jgi:GAF domain-containing protein/HAMP domain-containing protein